ARGSVRRAVFARVWADNANLHRCPLPPLPFPRLSHFHRLPSCHVSFPFATSYVHRCVLSFPAPGRLGTDSRGAGGNFWLASSLQIGLAHGNALGLFCGSKQTVLLPASVTSPVTAAVPPPHLRRNQMWPPFNFLNFWL
ncbi:unnamed protein product, partial [Phaeothamnion confervicola]